MQVLTFDFHNTLANCDPWFDLEVRDLPSSVIDHLRLPLGDASKHLVDRAYRQLRLDVIASGNEIDAYDAVSLVFEGLDIPADRAAVELAIDDLMFECTGAMRPVAGAVGTVRHLHHAGVKLGVVSSAVHHRTLEWILDALGITSCFDVVVTSASSGFYKSTTAIFQAALDRLDGDPATSVHVGDSLRWDVATAQQAGLTAVWLKTPRRETFASTTPTAIPDLTLDSLEDAGPVLVDLLERIRMPINA
ncbi:MAG: HAD family hydrolase [Chloroflexia bacterium]|nr:HAD family hydrolase [Chloroflexia bacterium]